MQVKYLPNYRKPESRSDNRALDNIPASVISVPNGRKFFGGYARAVVDKIKADDTVGNGLPNSDLLILAAIVDGIVDEIIHDLRQLYLVRVDENVAVILKRDGVPFPFAKFGLPRQDIADGFRDVESGQSERRRSRTEFGQIQSIVDKRC